MMGLVTPAEYVGCVEQAYRMHGEGRFYMDPKGHIVLDKYPGEWEAMPSYIEEPEAAACKWVSIRERNRAGFDLPTVFSILIYTHPETGFPLAICDGSYHTVMRTGGSAAVSAKWLARKDSKVLAIVGAGNMAEGALETCDKVFDWEEVRVWSRSQSTLDDFAPDAGAADSRYPLKTSTDLEAVVRGADVMVTITPAREPIVKDEWIAGGHPHRRGRRRQGRRPGARREDPAARADLRRRHPPVPDRRGDQRPAVGRADHRGGHRGRDRRSGRGATPGRTSDADITLFDSTGIALQDSATVPLEYERALAAGVGIEKKMIST